MYHKVRITVVSLVITLVCVLSSTGTLSYFTDTDAKTNSFVVGNASTVLAIYDDVSGQEKHILDVNDYSPLEDDTQVGFYLQATNDGNIPVYQRFRVVVPAALASVVTLNLPNMNSCVVETESEHRCDNDDYIVKYESSTNNGEFAEYYIMSKNAIPVEGNTVEWPTEKMTFGNISEVDDSVYTCGEDENDCAFGISVYSDAVQTTGFTNVEDAFVNTGETYNH